MFASLRRSFYRAVFRLMQRAFAAAGRTDVLDAPRQGDDRLTEPDALALHAALEERIRRLETRAAKSEPPE
ncbi:MAG: hypothetical protein GC206_09055 [Alphaproteobacteria bacterium]|nr:hypothetical protein [Alphaproteobacteria bacterium]